MKIDPSGHFILTALVVGAVIGAGIGAVSSGVKSYKNQKDNGGKVDGWTVVKDALVGGVVGGLVGAAAGVVGAAAAAAVTAVAGTGLAATMVAGAVGGVAGGIVSRGTNTILTGTASNIIQKNNLYNSAVYTQQKTPKQILDEAVGNAFDVKAMVTDAMLGAAFAGGGYAIKNLVSKLRAVRQHSCGSAPKVGVQNPVEDLAPSVKKFIDNAAKSATNFVDDAAKSVTDFVDDAAKSVTDFVDDAAKNVDDALNSLDDSKSVVDDAVNNTNKNSKTDTLAKNRAEGKAYEQQEFAKFSSQNSDAVEQITIKTSSGVKTRVDAIGIDPNGNVVISEFKSSATAPLTGNQKIAFPEILESGGTVVGKGKGIFSNGYQIPSGTEVKIIRP